MPSSGALILPYNQPHCENPHLIEYKQRFSAIFNLLKRDPVPMGLDMSQWYRILVRRLRKAMIEGPTNIRSLR